MLSELVSSVAARAPERPVTISPTRTLTYAELLRNGQKLAGAIALQRLDRFAIAVDELGDVLGLLLAASLTGSEACIYPRCAEPERVVELAEDFGHPVVVADSAADVPGPISVVSLDSLTDAEPLTEPSSESTPLLVLTTGTTGKPKGARHDWRRLAAGVRRPDEIDGTRWLFAYSVNQFGGLQVVIHALVSGSTLVVPASRQPNDVVAALTEHGVTHASGTPTFWRLLIRVLERRPDRALTLEQISIGGEAVPGQLVERLGELFPKARITQIYAATEFGSAIAVTDGRSGLPISVLDRGEDAAVQVRIVDGEIQMRSRIGMLGYHGGEVNSGEWRGTGDLVEVHGDRIHFVGRKTEIINVGGTKVHPLPLEELVCNVPGVEMAVAFGRPNPVTGQIVAVEVVSAPGADQERIKAAIRKACMSLPRAARPRSIRFVDEIKTRGNKLSRRDAGEPA